MPHTLAHPAVVLPLIQLARGKLSASALVIGSVAPDLAYFLPLGVERWQSHSAAGLLWFCLPVGLFAFGTFHWFVAALLVDMAPRPLRERLPGGWRHGCWPSVTWHCVLLSLLIGALTHVGWDAFTHAGDPAVRAWPWLAESLFEVQGRALRPYKLLQHGGSAFGVLVLAHWLRKVWRESTRLPDGSDDSRSTRWLLSSLVLLPPLCVSVSALWIATARMSGTGPRLDYILTRISFGGGTALVSSLLVVGAGWRLIRQPLPKVD